LAIYEIGVYPVNWNERCVNRISVVGEEEVLQRLGRTKDAISRLRVFRVFEAHKGFEERKVRVLISRVAHN